MQQILKHATRVICCALLGVLAVGCTNRDGTSRWGGTPWGQGSVDRQKARSVVFDPYPLNDIGPEVVGGRPRGFQQPLAEAKRNELQPQAEAKRQGFPFGR
jgi:hypothetical protein